MAAVKALEEDFAPLPKPAKPYVIQMEMIAGAHTVLMSDGRMFERVGDTSKAGQPWGPHWTWREVKGPDL